MACGAALLRSAISSVRRPADAKARASGTASSTRVISISGTKRAGSSSKSGLSLWETLRWDVMMASPQFLRINAQD